MFSDGNWQAEFQQYSRVVTVYDFIIKNVYDVSMSRSSFCWTLLRFIIVLLFFSPYCKLCCDQTLIKSLCLAANEEYYQLLMINDSQPSGLDVSSYTIEEIDGITSEYTLKNNVSH